MSVEVPCGELSTYQKNEVSRRVSGANAPLAQRIEEGVAYAGVSRKTCVLGRSLATMGHDEESLAGRPCFFGNGLHVAQYHFSGGAMNAKNETILEWDDPLLTTTPKSITPGVLALCRDIAPGATPEYVSVRTELYAEANECFAAVAKKIATDGGSIQHGWTIWQFGDWMAEGEFHAVWRSSQGALVDISPKPAGETSILFLPDPKLTYRGQRRDNRRRALVQSQLIDDYITVARKFFLMFDGANHLSMERDKVLLMASCQEVAKRMLIAGASANDACLCQSGRRYKNCHGQTVKTIRV